jgi:hypothetical protein
MVHTSAKKEKEKETKKEKGGGDGCGPMREGRWNASGDGPIADSRVAEPNKQLALQNFEHLLQRLERRGDDVVVLALHRADQQLKEPGDGGLIQNLKQITRSVLRQSLGDWPLSPASVERRSSGQPERPTAPCGTPAEPREELRSRKARGQEERET